MSSLIYYIKRLYWRLPINDRVKERLVTKARVWLRRIEQRADANKDQLVIVNTVLRPYIEQILAIPDKPGKDHIPLCDNSYSRNVDDPKIIAYYLTQFHPTKENDAWWGKGTTEWTFVSKAVPQYVGHYQPRLPGELGYYDLRIDQVMLRQIELAKMYGIYGFAFYYYWFNGKRLLEKPFDRFINNRQMDFPFCLCWANEPWTRRFDGTCGEILMEQSTDPKSYEHFIDTVIPYLKDPRYIRVKDKPIIIIYRPSFIPKCKPMLEYWRKRCRDAGVGEIVLIGIKENTWDANLISLGFDAQSEFHPGTLFRYCSNITNKIKYVREDFGGLVFDYQDIVVNKQYHEYSYQKLYRSVMPMWDNTPRRNNTGMIFENATPQLYKQWLTDVLVETRLNQELDDKLVFINAWNEWGEGAYLEPDRRYGYAFLQATREAIEDTRNCY